MSLPATHTQARLVRRPAVGEFDTATVFEVATTDAPKAEDVKDGDLLIKTLYLSMDPAMRTWVDEVDSYLPSISLGSVMRGSSIGEVIVSRHSDFKPGDVVSAFEQTWQNYAIITPSLRTKVLKLFPGINYSDYLGLLGGTGLTAYFGLLDVGQFKKGDVVVVSGAAGATGSIAGQIAKINGASLVVGIAGSAEKGRWLVEECGYDVVINYREPDYVQKLKDALPNGVDVYFDNVAGEISEKVYELMNLHGRVVACGAISQYNSPNPTGLSYRSYGAIITKSLRVQGFIILNFAARWAEGAKVLGGWLAEGKLKRSETIVKGGIADAPRVLSTLFSGANTGKLLLQVE